MNTIVEQYRKQLTDLDCYEQNTVANYISCIYKYIKFAQFHLGIDPTNTTPQHLKQWMIDLKKKNVSNSRMTHYKSALTGFHIPGEPGTH